MDIRKERKASLSIIIFIVTAILLAESTSIAMADNDYTIPYNDTVKDEVVAKLRLMLWKFKVKGIDLYAEKNGVEYAAISIGEKIQKTGSPVGSISKSITAIAIAQLIQDNKLKLSSSVAETLGRKYAIENREMPQQLQGKTIENLLTHTAGLRPNKITDPIRGVATEDVFPLLNQSPTIFEFVKASEGDVSDGSSDFKYSNMSYLMLGLVIEAVTGETYTEYCRRRIFAPLGIANPQTLQGKYACVSPYIGWVITPQDVVRIWSNSFSIYNINIISRPTLDQTLFAHLGQPLGTNKDIFYTLGVRIKRLGGTAGYRLSHNGVAPNSYSYVEANFPGIVWAFSVYPVPKQAYWNKLNEELRKFVYGEGI